MIYLHLCLNLVPTLANKYIPHSSGRDSGGGPWVHSPGTHLFPKVWLWSCEQQAPEVTKSVSLTLYPVEWPRLKNNRPSIQQEETQEI